MSEVTNFTINIDSTPSYTIDVGTTGTRGKGATVAVGTTTTLHSGLDASVSNTGTTTDAVFDFSIPKGSVWLSGTGEPASSLGDEGDYYLNTIDNTIYNKVNSTTWSLIGSISPSVSWGSLIGTLSNQTDLQDELDLKVDKVEGKSLSTNDLTDTLKTNYDTAHTNAVTNYEHLIHGNTIYGGTIVTDLDAITKSGFYTCYGAATGAPSSSYSWFVLHQNSNAETASATQRAVAYNSTLIIYERVKTSSTWGAWALQGGNNITQLGTCSTASATAEKSVTLDGFILATGATILVKFTNANTSSTITLNVNSTGAKDIYDAKGNQITGDSFTNAANEDCLFTYNGTNWELISAPFWMNRMSSPSDTYIDLTLGASGSSNTAPADGTFYLVGRASAGGQFVLLWTSTWGDVCWSNANTNLLRASLDVKKGTSVVTTYTATSDLSLKFIYKEGSKP